MRGFAIGSAFGIPIKLHWTFLVILPVFAAFIGWDIALIGNLLNSIFDAGINPEALEESWQPWALGFVAAVGLFAGVLLHELGHSLVAVKYGYEIDEISLWLLGGLANFAEMPDDWRHEFWIAVTGPIVSIAVGVGCYLGFLLTPPDVDHVRFVLGYLAVLNVFLAMFNMLPAFPMDGGRVLRALLGRTRPHAQATQGCGDRQGICRPDRPGGTAHSQLHPSCVGLFRLFRCRHRGMQTTMKAAFEGVTVANMMTPQESLHIISPDATIATLMERMFYERHTGYPVASDGDVAGIVTLDDARNVGKVERDAYLVADVMAEDVITITPDADAMEALNRMQDHNIGRLPVVTHPGELVGIISRTDLMQALNVIQAGEGRIELPSKPGAPRMVLVEAGYDSRASV